MDRNRRQGSRDAATKMAMRFRKAKLQTVDLDDTTSGDVEIDRTLIIENRTDDPAAPEVGRIWLRTDL